MKQITEVNFWRRLNREKTVTSSKAMFSWNREGNGRWEKMSNGYQIDGKSTETKHYLIINELIGNKSILGDPDFFNSRSKFFETISKLFALKALEKLEIGDRFVLRWFWWKAFIWRIIDFENIGSTHANPWRACNLRLANKLLRISQFSVSKLHHVIATKADELSNETGRFDVKF